MQSQRFQARTKSFTRRARALPANLERLMQDSGDRFVLDVPRDDGYTTVAPYYRFDPESVFGRQAPLIIEIGSGVGEQVVAAAKERPEVDFLAFEVWQPGIAKTVSKALAAKISNLRIIEADAQQAFPVIFADGVAAEVWTFFPDPWRKARHRKRRLVSPHFAQEVRRVLAPGGVWRVATDWDDYAWQMRDVLEGAEGFANPYQGQNTDPDDPEPERGGFAPRFEGRVLTHFEERGHEAGRKVHDVMATKVS